MGDPAVDVKSSPGSTSSGVRGFIGQGSNQRPIRLDLDEPEISEELNALVREVRQSDVSKYNREMDMKQKNAAHNAEMKMLLQERLSLPQDITDLPKEHARSAEIRHFRRHKQSGTGDPLSFVYEQQRKAVLHGIEKVALASSPLLVTDRGRNVNAETPRVRSGMKPTPLSRRGVSRKM